MYFCGKAATVEGYATTANTLLTAMPGGYNRDLQDTKELYMEGLRITRSSLRIMTLMIKSLGVNPDKLRAGFIPGVFATDNALERVANGVPFRDAYQYVRSHLDELEAVDPDQAIAAKTHEGTTGGLDFDFYKEKIKNVRGWVRERRKHAEKAFSKLLGVPFPIQ